MDIGTKCKFQYQPERLTYLGKKGVWHQFELEGKPGVWCELLDSDLHGLELITPIITAEEFSEATGHAPEQDDLERVNCPLAGTMMHNCCGWNEKHNKPQYQIGPTGVNYDCKKTNHKRI